MVRLYRLGSVGREESSPFLRIRGDGGQREGGWDREEKRKKLTIGI